MTETAAGALRNDTDRCAAHFERLYEASPDELWAALTEPAQLRRWLAETPTFDAELGGRVAIDFGDGGTVAGEVLSVEHGRVLEYTWTFTGEDESVVRFELHPQEHGTLLVLDHRLLGRTFGAGYGAGWHAHLDRLGALVTGGSLEWLPRFQELLPAYQSQASELGWDRPATSAVRESLYRGDRAAAEAAAAGARLDVYDASALGRADRLTELLDTEPELVDTVSDDGFTPLHLACFSGATDAVRLLVERGAPLERRAESPIARVRPLATAVFAGAGESASLLLQAGADANGGGDGGFVPLHTAAQNGDAELVRLLLAYGADPLRPTAEGRTPLDLARAAGAEECVALLEEAAA